MKLAIVTLYDACMGKRVPYLQRSLMILGEKRLALQIEIAQDHSWVSLSFWETNSTCFSMMCVCACCMGSTPCIRLLSRWVTKRRIPIHTLPATSDCKKLKTAALDDCRLLLRCRRQSSNAVMKRDASGMVVPAASYPRLIHPFGALWHIAFCSRLPRQWPFILIDLCASFCNVKTAFHVRTEAPDVSCKWMIFLRPRLVRKEMHVLVVNMDFHQI